MKSYAEYQEEISGLNDVSETIKTIEKIAASQVISLRKKSFFLNTYTNKLKKTLFQLLNFYSPKNNSFLGKRKKGKKIILVITSNKGLVGGLWHKIIDEFIEVKGAYDIIYSLGSKGTYYLKEEGINIDKIFSFIHSIPTDDEVFSLGNVLFNDFKHSHIEKIDILYADYKTISEQKIVKIPFLPFSFQFENDDIKNKRNGLPLFEQNKKEIFNAFLKKYIKSFFYSIILESTLSEFSAKMIEMEHAAEKSKEITKEITKDYIKGKRKNVTQRQLETFNYKKL